MSISKLMSFIQNSLFSKYYSYFRLWHSSFIHSNRSFQIKELYFLNSLLLFPKPILMAVFLLLLPMNIMTTSVSSTFHCLSVSDKLFFILVTILYTMHNTFFLTIMAATFTAFFQNGELLSYTRR